MPVASQTLREIAACFPTGVTVVTARDTDGTLRGLTTNAFASLSAEPPLVMVSLGLQSNTLPAIQRSRAFVLNFLEGACVDIADRFASKSEDKFRELAYQPAVGAAGAPILEGRIIGHAECLVDRELTVGDHVLLIGLVVGGEARPEGSPLMYYRRCYSTWDDHAP